MYYLYNYTIRLMMEEHMKAQALIHRFLTVLHPILCWLNPKCEKMVKINIYNKKYVRSIYIFVYIIII